MLSSISPLGERSRGSSFTRTALGYVVGSVLAAAERLEGAPGRMQRVGSARGGEAYVDYAHTPDGLRTVLQALRPHVRGKLVAVIGAGGDRDRTKRPGQYNSQVNYIVRNNNIIYFSRVKNIACRTKLFNKPH